ncbi:MAG: FHA domain-containing protein [Myxococcota bacterium]|nr:FHA domain-containing protein [Myxococcota bacterium]
MSARLEILEEERSVDLGAEGDVVLGRENDCDVVLANPAVSRYHVKLFSRGIEWLVEDLGSRHGSLLNGAPLKENHAVSLRDRDRLEIAGTQVIFHAEKPDLATEERTAFLAQQVVADMLGSLSGQESSPYLRYLDGPEEGQRVMLDGQTPYLIFGRSPDCDVMLDESNVSRRHARVTVDFSGIWIEDLGSKNGIQVGGEVVREKVRLKDRTEVQVGGVRMMFCDPASAYLGDLDKSSEVSAAQSAADEEEAEAPSGQSVAVPLATGQDSSVSLDAVAEADGSASKTMLELDEDGNWSKSMPKLDSLDAAEPELTHDASAPKFDQDLLLLGLFGGAALLLLVVIGLLLV